jgi:hypothetical protein
MASARGLREVLLVMILLGFSHSAVAGQTLVYDNSTNYVHDDYYTPDGFWPFNSFSAIDPEGEIIYVNGTGDQIRLAEGTDRTVVKFDLILSSTEYTTLDSLTLVFHALGEEIAPGMNYPGEVLWTGTKTNEVVNGLTHVFFDVQNVEVPDEFVWVAYAYSDVAGPVTCSPPTTGQSSVYDFFWTFDSYDNDWWYNSFYGDPPADFAARVWAVPEPSTTALLLIGGWLAARWKRRS